MSKIYLVAIFSLSLISLVGCKQNADSDSNQSDQIEENVDSNNDLAFDELAVDFLNTVNYQDIVKKFSNGCDLTKEENQKDLIYYSFYKFSNSKSSLALDYVETKGENVFMTENNLRIKLNNQGFKQKEVVTNENSSENVNFASRSYYKNNFKDISYYKEKSQNMFIISEYLKETKFTLNEYMQKFGKLDFNAYQVNNDLEFLDNGISNHLNVVDTTTMLQIHPDITKSFNFMEDIDNDTYKLNFKLKSDAVLFLKNEIKGIFNITPTPKIKGSIDCSFTIDKNLNLVNSINTYSYDIYSYGVTKSFETTYKTSYFVSSGNNLTIKGKNLYIPEIKEGIDLKMDSNFKVTFY